MSRKNGKEISVAEAAECLKVTERTVINFIRSKKLKATKLGKRWFADDVSIQNLSPDTDNSKVFESEKVVAGKLWISWTANPKEADAAREASRLCTSSAT